MLNSFAGIRFVVVERMIWAVPRWRFDAFANGLDAWLAEEWIENEACPPPGTANVSIARGVAFCDRETWQEISDTVQTTRPADAIGRLW